MQSPGVAEADRQALRGCCIEGSWKGAVTFTNESVVSMSELLIAESAARPNPDYAVLETAESCPKCRR
jgi:hypothetical protein